MWVYPNRYEFGSIGWHRRMTGDCCLSFRHHNKRCLGSKLQIYDSDHNQQYSTYFGTIFACRYTTFLSFPFYLTLLVLWLVNHSASHVWQICLPTYLLTYLHVTYVDMHRCITVSPLLSIQLSSLSFAPPPAATKTHAGQTRQLIASYRAYTYILRQIFALHTYVCNQ